MSRPTMCSTAPAARAYRRGRPDRAAQCLRRQQSWPASAPCARTAPRTSILRTAWVYSPFGRNFVQDHAAARGASATSCAVVGDQHGNPTRALDIADGDPGHRRSLLGARRSPAARHLPFRRQRRRPAGAASPRRSMAAPRRGAAPRAASACRSRPPIIRRRPRRPANSRARLHADRRTSTASRCGPGATALADVGARAARPHEARE